MLFLECTSNQIKAKIEFLEKNNLLLTCECDALELNSIKVLPELAATSNILFLMFIGIILSYRGQTIFRSGRHLIFS